MNYQKYRKKKVCLYLTEGLDNDLRTKAEAFGLNKSELLRRILEDYIKSIKGFQS